MKYLILPIIAGIISLAIESDITILLVTILGIAAYSVVKIAEKLAERKYRQMIAKKFREEMNELAA